MLCCPKWDRTSQVLMFGPGQAGKSTIVKSLRFILSGKSSFKEFLEDRGEKERVRMQMRINIVEAVHCLCVQAQKHLTLEEFEAQRQDLSLDLIMGDSLKAQFSTKQARVIKAFWESHLGKRIWQLRNEKNYEIHDNANEFIPKCDLICRNDYEPTLDDFLLYRQETKFLEEFKLEMSETSENRRFLQIMDCGGQANHQQMYQSEKSFRDFSQEASLLFLVIPIGDLGKESEKKCITDGFLILDSLLSADLFVHKTGKDGKPKIDEDGKPKIAESVSFQQKVIVVFLNKKDKLRELVEHTGAQRLLDNWRADAVKNLNSKMDDVKTAKEADSIKVLLQAIKENDQNVSTADDAEQFFKNLVERVCKISSKGKRKAAVRSNLTSAIEPDEAYLIKFIAEQSFELSIGSALQDSGFYAEDLDIADEAKLDFKGVESVALCKELGPKLRPFYDRFVVDEEPTLFSRLFGCGRAAVKRRGLREKELKQLLDDSEFPLDINDRLNLKDPFVTLKVEDWLKEVKKSMAVQLFPDFLERYVGILVDYRQEKPRSPREVISPLVSTSTETTRRSSNFSFADQYASKDPF